MYVSMASFSGLERLYSLLEGRGAPGSKSMPQVIGSVGWQRLGAVHTENLLEVVILCRGLK